MSLAAFLSILAAALALAIIFLALIGRMNGADDADDADAAITPPTDTDEPPLGDQVDVRAILHRYSGD